MFALKTGISWNQPPRELLGVSGVTCWRRLRDWTEAGVWPALHELLLAQLRACGALDLDRCAVDGSHVRAARAGPQTRTCGPSMGEQVGPSPVDRGRPGSKDHLIVDANGIPLQVSLSGGNCNDVTRLLPLVDAISPIRGQRGWPRRRLRE